MIHFDGSERSNICTRETFEDFDLSFQWKASNDGNSGVFYRVQLGGKQPAHSGLEYAIQDRRGNDAKEHSGAIFGIYANDRWNSQGSGQWNKSRILHRGNKIEHWLNDELVVSAVIGSDKWNQLAGSIITKFPSFAKNPQGHIVLQGLRYKIWYKDFVIKDLSKIAGRRDNVTPLGQVVGDSKNEAEGNTNQNPLTQQRDTIPDIKSKDWVSLFNGKDLSGWARKQGTATYRVQDRAIVGRTMQSSANTYLCTDKEYGDFELTFETKILGGNSGVQIRSLSKPEYKNGKVHGPQIEIEPAPGSSGYLYSEGTGRQWITRDQPIQDALINDQWNRYIIRAEGDRIQTWVNGQKIADIHDPKSSKNGFIGLQVHSIKNDQGPFEMGWRDIRIRELRPETD